MRHKNKYYIFIEEYDRNSITLWFQNRKPTSKPDYSKRFSNNMGLRNISQLKRFLNWFFDHTDLWKDHYIKVEKMSNRKWYNYIHVERK